MSEFMPHTLVLQPVADVLSADQIRHHFVGQDDRAGVYAKEVHIPSNTFLVSHKHTYDHLSILASGFARIRINGLVTSHTGPKAITIRKGEEHTVFAVTNVVWFCIHPTDETDEAKVDDIILSGVKPGASE